MININVTSTVNIPDEVILGRPESDLTRHDTYEDAHILVTGGGGSIGSELVRHLNRLDRVSKIYVVDNSELAIYNLLESIEDKSRIVVKLVDARSLDLGDHQWLGKVTHIFHAAAYKHVPINELNAKAALINNVDSCIVVCNLADRLKARLTLISTDKAVRPTSIMGATKLLTEMICRSCDNSVITRFGNVIGSTGSVVPKFISAIQSGDDVTLTSKDMTRYFMTIPEAVCLVVNTSQLAEPRSTNVLDMGEPVLVYDMAKRMIEHFDSDSKIIVTGLRPGEKLYEELLTIPDATELTAKVMTSTSDVNNPMLDSSQYFRLYNMIHGNGVYTREKLVNLINEIEPESSISYDDAELSAP